MSSAKTASRSRNTRRPASTGAETSTRRRGAGAADEPLIAADDVEVIAQQISAFAERSIGATALGPLATLAPTLLNIATRYARREPGRAAGALLLVAGLYLVGRAVLAAAGSAAAAAEARAT